MNYGARPLRSTRRLSNQIGVRLNLLNLLTQTGELLDERGIVVR